MHLCHVCGRQLRSRFAKVEDAQSGEIFSILACDNCGAAQTFPQPEDLSLYYAAYYGTRHGFTIDHCNRRRLSWLENNSKVKTKRRLLDVGCGDGSFLRAAVKRGWRGVGTELGASELQDANFEIYADLKDVTAKYGNESFDAVTMWHTLEHFRNPPAILREVSALLARDGVLLVAVPNARGWQARIFGKFWFHLDVPRHLFHFSSKSLDKLLEQSGFMVRRKWHQEFEYDLLGWSQSGLNYMFSAPNVFFKYLTGHHTNVVGLIRAVHVVFGAIFSALAVPLVLFGTLRKKGGTLVVRASK